MGVSERNLFRKLNELMGMPPQKYLRKQRMKRAMENLTKGYYRTVNETAYSVGYLNVSYFISQFEKEFNVKPLQVLRNSGWR
ncbi:MAG: AraC-like DNA-binding protein [Saprospiraceae bacterium]|jgi:AraC-like DNA-binding protein